MRSLRGLSLGLAALLLAPFLRAAEVAAPLKWRDALNQPAVWYASAAARELADTVLLYQFPNGGWPKNREMTLAPAVEAAARAKPVPADEQMPTIDNGATHAQLVFLARVLTADNGSGAHRAAVERGLDYLLTAQYPNGGWPQFFPLREGYYRHITFNDDAMASVLEVLHAVAQGRAPFAFIDPDRRTRAAAAVARGVDCILRCQIVIEGKKTAWCAQHDEHTFAPAPARKFEPATLSGMESVGLVRFLLQVEPTAEVVAAVEAAAAWFEQVKLVGLRYGRVPAPDLPKGYDNVVTPDPAAPPLWARFYELGTNRSVFTGRDTVIHYALNEIEHERRIGYAWYGTAPAKLLAKEIPAWRRSLKAFTTANVERDLRPLYPQLRRVPDELPAGVTAVENLTYAPGLQLDVYRPSGTGLHPAVLIVHAGGWDSGSRQMERPFAQRLAARGYVTVPMSYRLGPAGRFPAALHDLKAAVRWLRAHAAEHGVDANRIAIAGMSAGGTLAALLGATNGLAEFEGEVGERTGSSTVQVVIDIDGLVDFTAPELVAQQNENPSAPTRFLGGSFAENPATWRAASALTHAGPSSAPMLFITSTAVTPILPGRAAMQEKLRASGVPCELITIPATPHPFWLFEPWAAPTIEATDAFLRRVLERFRH